MKSHEVAIIIILAQNQFTSEESFAVFNLKAEMNKAGYTDIATSVGIKTLVNKRLIITFITSDNWNRDEYSAVSLTQHGEKWILENQGHFVFRIEKPVIVENSQPSVDDLPF